MPILSCLNIETNMQCHDINCKMNIYSGLDFLTRNLLSSSKEFNRKTKNTFRFIPRWNDHFKTLHSIARNEFITGNSLEIKGLTLIKPN